MAVIVVVDIAIRFRIVKGITSQWHCDTVFRGLAVVGFRRWRSSTMLYGQAPHVFQSVNITLGSDTGTRDYQKLHDHIPLCRFLGGRKGFEIFERLIDAALKLGCHNRILGFKIFLEGPRKLETMACVLAACRAMILSERVS